MSKLEGITGAAGRLPRAGGDLVIAALFAIGIAAAPLTRIPQNGHNEGATKRVYVRRFSIYQPDLHLTTITSFLGLALTGMIVKFSCVPRAKVAAKLLGDFEAAGLPHRF